MMGNVLAENKMRATTSLLVGVNSIAHTYYTFIIYFTDKDVYNKTISLVNTSIKYYYRFGFNLLGTIAFSIKYSKLKHHRDSTSLL